MMNKFSLHLAAFTVIVVSVTAATAIRADEGFENQQNAYVVTRLVTDLPGKANFQDPVLQNAWGVAFSPAGSPFWIADNATGCSTLYAGDGSKVALQVSIPLPDNVVPTTSCKTVDPHNPPMNAAPTGIIWNPSSAFIVPGTKSTNPPNGIQASFIFSLPRTGRFPPGPGGSLLIQTMR